MKFFYLILFLLIYTFSYCQSVGIGTTNPHTSAILDINSTNKGFLMPRVSDFASVINNPASGLMVYDPDRKAFYMYDGANWNQIVISSEMPFQISSQNRIIPYSHGAKLGLGLSTPLAKLHINHKSLTNSPFLSMVDSSSGSGQMFLFSKLGSTNSFRLNTSLNNNANTSFLSYFSGSNTTPSLQIQANNKVSVNKNTATETLDVGGNIKTDTLKSNALYLSPNAGEGKILTSDAFGNASWQMAQSSSTATGNLGQGYWGDCTTNLYLENYQTEYDTLSENGDNFGYAISMDGIFTAVGVPNDNAGKGSVTIYKFNNEQWQYFQKLEDPSGATNDNFGTSVCIKGTRLVIGSPLDDDNGTNRGSACIFHYNGTSWNFITKILGETSGDIFGTSVVIDSNLAVIGAPYNDFGQQTRAGAIRIYQYNGTAWNLINTLDNPEPLVNDYFGTSVSLDSLYFAVGAVDDDNSTADNKGRVFFYKLNGTTPVLLNSFFGPVANSKYGESIDLYNNFCVVTASNGGTASGSIHIYKRNIDTWSKIQTVTDPLLDINSYYGSAVALNSNYLLIGAKRQPLGNQADVGAFLLYKKNGNQFKKVITVDNPGGYTTNGFGSALSIDENNRFVIAAPYLNTSNEPGYCSFGKIKP